MNNKIKIGMLLSAILLCAIIVYAADFVPSGDINGKNIYNIKNFKDINGTKISASGNVSIVSGNRYCTEATCAHGVFYNGTHTVIQ